MLSNFSQIPVEMESKRLAKRAVYISAALVGKLISQSFFFSRFWLRRPNCLINSGIGRIVDLDVLVIVGHLILDDKN